MLWIALAVVLILIVIVMYNGLVGKRNKVRNSWGQIDVQLKRRFDLIPNLVETVKGYAAHEKQTFEEVTSARTRYMDAGTPAEKMEANTQMSGVLNRLFAVAESYPQLKANENFGALQRELSETENKIGFSRQFYNDVVMEYNNAVQMFPSSIIAGLFGFTQEPFFQASEAEKTAPQVKF